MSNNPLAGYFRMPGMHITLPTEGKFNDPSIFSTAMNGELEVFPMTATDELYTKNADALFNGTAVEKIIKSCVPGISNPRVLPGNDVDYILLCVKKVTYGDELKLNCTCPKCKEEHTFTCDIDEVLSRVTPFEDNYSVRVNDDLVINLKPYDYESSTKLNLAAFEEANLIRGIVNIELTEQERTQLFAASFEKIASLNIALLENCVKSIVTPQAVVTDRGHIKEYMLNTTKDVVKKINDKMVEIGKCGLDKSVEIVCPNEKCGHTWSTETIFDPSHFFE